MERTRAAIEHATLVARLNESTPSVYHMGSSPRWPPR